VRMRIKRDSLNLAERLWNQAHVRQHSGRDPEDDFEILLILGSHEPSPSEAAMGQLVRGMQQMKIPYYPKMN